MILPFLLFFHCKHHLQDKVRQTLLLCKRLYDSRTTSVKHLEKLVGTLVSLTPAVSWAPLHYRKLQGSVVLARRYSWPTNTQLKLSPLQLGELRWWLSPRGFRANLSSPIRPPAPTVSLWTDANPQMGGALNDRGQFCQTQWEGDNVDLHINIKETLAATMGIKFLTKEGDSVLLHVDNSACASSVRKMGTTTSLALNDAAVTLWNNARARGIKWITPTWLPTEENVSADFLSRHWIDSFDYRLTDEAWLLLQEKLYRPTMDVFASADTFLFKPYLSWYKDDAAAGRDAFLFPWPDRALLHPPTPLIQKVLNRVREEGNTAILIAPRWKTSLWWPILLSMAVATPVSLPPNPVYFPDGRIPGQHLTTLLAFPISGRLLQKSGGEGVWMDQW